MALELHIAGPGLDFTRRLSPGDPALILGRDADCSVCLPDPERNVSRRHLSVWNENGELHFHVLSVVNGVDLPQGEVPPGGRGVLQQGETLQLSGYRLTLSTSPQDEDFTDPWAALDRQSVMDTIPAGQQTMPAPLLDDDPFGDWGFGSTFGPGAPGGGLDAEGLAPATDLRTFYAGLGLDPARMPALTVGELETIGRITRMAVIGLLQAQQVAAGSKQDLRAEDRTMIGQRETNPLRMEGTHDAKLQYLFGGRMASAGFTPPDRAVLDVVTELIAHEQALAEAVKQAIEGTLAEFEPEVLKARLIGAGARLFESARAWDAFVRDYADQRLDLEKWVRRLLDRHFADAYAREFVRVKRDATGSAKRR